MLLLNRKLKSSLIIGLFAVDLMITSLFLSAILGNQGAQANNGTQLPAPQIAEMTEPTTWWDGRWDYRVRVEVNNSNTDIIKETPIEKRINFTNLLKQVGDPDRLDIQSIRVVEYAQSGEWIEMRSRWNATEDTANLLQWGSNSYDDNQDIFDLTWTLNGTTQANQNRTFYVYFNSLGASVSVGLPNYGFNAYYLDYMDYRKIADYSSGALTRNDPWDRAYWTAAEGLKDPYTATATGNNTFNPFVANLNYEGWVHQYLTGSGRQTHVGEVYDNPASGYFPIQWSGANRWYMTQYPIFTVTMRVDNPAALTSFYILNSVGGWNITGYTPNSRDTQGGYNNGVDRVNGFTIICDGQWHTYAYDMRRISLSPTAYISCIEMFQNTFVGAAHNITMDNMFFYKSDVAGVDPLYSNYTRNLPEIWMGEAHVKSALLKVQCLDVDGNALPNANITLVNSSDSAILSYNLTNNEGYTLFPALSYGNYSFEAKLHSNVVDGLTTLINSTVGIENVSVNSLFPEVTLNCLASRTVFTLNDVNGNPLESGYILTGNETHWNGIQNSPIGVDGKAYFYWYNVTPHTDFEYNFTVFYQNVNYRETSTGLSTIVLYTGTIESGNRTELTLKTNLTTQYFSVLSDSIPNPPIPGAEIRITNSSSGVSVVNLTTDASGNAVFRWLIANETGGNSNYTFQIYFFGNAKPFNTTWGPAEYHDTMNVTLNLTQSWEFRAIIDLSKYQTALVTLVPGGFIETEWGREIRVRVLFNVTKTDSGTLGPTWASYVNYQVKLGATVVLSGAFYQISYYTGWYEVSINSSLLTGDDYYTLDITGVKSGYTDPSPVSIPVSIINAPSSLTLSAGSSTVDTWWNDTESISVDFTVDASEQINIQNLISKMAMSGKLSLWDLQNNWNLTKVVFNFDNVYWDETLAGAVDLNVTGPDGFTTANLADAVPLAQTSIDLNTANVRDLVYEKHHGSIANSYLFTIGGNFDNAVNGNLTAYFVRNQVNATFQAEVKTADTTLAIKRFSSGWTINYLNITLSSISGGLPFSSGDIKISLPTGTTYDFIPTGSLGCLEIFDLDLYPSNDSWVFGITTSRDFTASIVAGMRQVISIHTLLETISANQDFTGITNSSGLPINIDGNQFSSGTTVLRVSNLVNASTGQSIYPGDVNLQVTMGTTPYVFGNLQSPGETSIPLNSMSLATLYDYAFSVDGGQDVYFNVTLEQTMSRGVTSATTGTISYAIREEPSVYGFLSTVPNINGQYAVNFYTGVLDARIYTFQIRSTRANFATAALDLDLNIAELPTLVGVYGDPGAIDYIFNDQINVTYGRDYSLYLNDTHNTQPVIGATVSYSWRRLNATTNALLSSGIGTMVDNNNGSYTLDFITSTTPVGKYTFLFSFIKPNFETRTAYIEVNVQLKAIAFELVGFVEGATIKKPQGETIVIAIDLKDVAAGGIPLTGATVKLFFDNHWVDMSPDGTITGRYVYTIDTSTYSALFAQIDFPSRISVTLANYTLGQADIIFTVAVAPPEFVGIPLIYWIIAIVAVGAMVGIFAVMKGVKNARIPQIIKDITRTRGEIKKRRSIDKIQISPTKAELISKMFEGEWATIGLTYPAPPDKKVEESRSVPDEIEKKEATG